MIFLYCSAGLFVASIVLFAFVLFGERPLIASRVLKELLGAFILGFLTCWSVAQLIMYQGA